MRKYKPKIDYQEKTEKGRVIRIAKSDDRDAQLDVLFKTVMPVAVETYQKKVLGLGEPTIPLDRRLAHADGYTNGFCDAVYFILSGLLVVHYYKVDEPQQDEL